MNYVNVTHMLAERHQMQRAQALVSSKYLLNGTELQAVAKQITFYSLPQTLIISYHSGVTWESNNW